jgi:hypothetical protein
MGQCGVAVESFGMVGTQYPYQIWEEFGECCRGTGCIPRLSPEPRQVMSGKERLSMVGASDP